MEGEVKEGEIEKQSPASEENTPKEDLANKMRGQSISSNNGAMLKKNMKNKPKPLHFWNTGDVNKWLKKHGGQYHNLYGELLNQHEVTGRTLIRMNEIKLEKIGITDPTHRKELMQHILRLRLKHEVADLKTLDQKGSGFELKLPENRCQPSSSVDKGDK